MKFLSIAVASAFAVVAVPAMAQANLNTAAVAATVRAEKNPELKRFSFEARPVESLLSSTPGLASGGASAEVYLGFNWALAVGGSYADVDLPQKYVATVNDETDQPVVNRGYGYTVGSTLRYYDDPIGDSFYGGGSLDYSESHVGWELDDDTFASTQYALTPSLVAGYRWVWQNGFLARLGAGVGLPSVQSQDVVAETSGPQSAEGLDKINDMLDTKVAAKLDLGLGVMF